MFIYTIKLIVSGKNKEQFVEYLYQKYLPKVMNTGCFSAYNVKTNIESDEIIAKYKCKCQEDFDNYMKNHSEVFYKDINEKFPDSILNIERDFVKII